MMLAIIDGGSTKADWQIRKDDQTSFNLTTTGFNPNYDSIENIERLLQTELNGSFPKEKPIEIHYYGAGCWDPSRKIIVKTAFESVFSNADIHIEHDLLAAARATCGNQPGIACILGTGSNSVLYDGKVELDNVTNLGFLLGDEGSGAMIGKRLVQAYFYREMPVELHYVMQQECPNGRMDILNKIYDGSVPAAYLATYTKKFKEHRDHPFIKQTIKDCFDEFLRRHVFKYDNYQSLPIHFVGSVAFHFQDVLKALLDGYNLQMGVVLPRPIEALFEYHLKKGTSTSK